MKKKTLRRLAFLLAATLILSPFTKAAAASSLELLKSDSFTSKSKIYDASSKKVITRTYYHNNIYKDCKLFKGLDVSWWQSSDKVNTKVDWAKAHADGIDFAFIRIGSRERDKKGELYEDTSADSNITQAVKNNVNVGVYFFSQALSVKEAKAEAKYTLKILKKHNWKITLPVVFDYEYNGRLKAGMLKKATMTKICAAFCDTIKAAGYTPCIYANYNMFKSSLDTPTLAKSYKIWLARYNFTTTNNTLSTSTEIPYADIPYRYEFWQFASTGRIKGYSGNIDCDYWYKNTAVKTNGLTVTDQNTDSITLDWKPASDAKNYKVYRYSSDTQSYKAIGTVKTSGFVDDEVSSGTTYSYKVRCYWTIGGTNYYGKYSDILETATLPKKVDKIEVTKRNATSLTLSWDKVKGADGYRIYQYDEEQKTDIRLDVTDSKTTTYTVTDLKGAKGYSFKIRAFKNTPQGTLLSSYSDSFDTYTRPAKVTGMKVTSTKKKRAKLTFNKVYRADHYSIYRYDKKTAKWTYITSISKDRTSFINVNLVSGRTYQYRMRAYITTEDGKIYSYYNEPVSVKVK